MAKEQLYVVLFSQVAHDHHRGDVVTEAQLGDDVAVAFDPEDPKRKRLVAGERTGRLSRYLAQNAVREITADETVAVAKLAADKKPLRLTLDAPDKPAVHSQEAKFVQLERRISEAQGRAAQFEELHGKAEAMLRELEAQLALANKEVARVPGLEKALAKAQAAAKSAAGAA
ncbi:MAG: hypothetical protein KGL39_10730 [Patescibacteria group bacterium]|nr:hypothetical protein [Patescibacteria group bacterium]